MIAQGTRFRIARVPLARIVFTMSEPRRLQHIGAYAERLAADPTADVLIPLAPYDTTVSGQQLYTPLDGHHRTLASLVSARPDVLAIIHYEPGQPGYDAALAPESL